MATKVDRCELLAPSMPSAIKPVEMLCRHQPTTRALRGFTTTMNVLTRLRRLRAGFI